MARSSLIPLATIVFALTGAPAAAQQQPSAESVRAAHVLAACGVRNKASLAESYAAQPGPAADNAYDRLLDGCLRNGAPPLDPRLVRGSIYEAMYERDFASGGARTFDSVPPLAMPTQGTNPAFEGALLRFGECVVRAAPADARALLASEPGGGDETSAIAALNPRLSPCMTSGLTVTFSAPVLRGVIAEALYKLSRGVPAMAAR